jgi:predicted transcriptional regulator
VGLFAGYRALEGISCSGGKVRLQEFMDKNYLIVHPDTKLFDIVEKLYSRKATAALVLYPVGGPEARNVLGIIDKEHIMDAIESAFDLFSE